jgi:hypothetical protein
MKNLDIITLPSGKTLELVIFDETEFESRPLMEPEHKQKWIAALKSGRYIQGEMDLVQDNGTAGFKHCCLGVLCEIDGYVKTNNELESYSDFLFHIKGMLCDSHLPEDYAAGIGGPGDFNGFKLICRPRPGSLYTLAGLNDAGYDFNDIAHVIQLLF